MRIKEVKVVFENSQQRLKLTLGNRLQHVILILGVIKESARFATARELVHVLLSVCPNSIDNLLGAQRHLVIIITNVVQLADLLECYRCVVRKLILAGLNLSC